MSLSIRKVRNHGKIRYRLNLGKKLTGMSRYQRKFFPSIRAARKFVQELSHLQDQSSHFLASLPAAARVGLVALYRLLEAKGIFVDAVQDILSRLEVAEDGTERLVGGGVNVDKAVDEFLANRKALNLDPDTIREYRSKVQRLTPPLR